MPADLFTKVSASCAMRGFIESASPASGLRTGDTFTRMPRTPSAFNSASSVSLVLLSSRSMMPRRTAGSSLAHSVEHAGIVEAVGTRLHEHIAHETGASRQLEIGLKRLVGRLVADVGPVRIFFRRSEYVEMRVAGLWRRRESRLNTCVRVVRSGTVHSVSVRPRRRHPSSGPASLAQSARQRRPRP